MAAKITDRASIVKVLVPILIVVGCLLMLTTNKVKITIDFRQPVKEHLIAPCAEE